jgi:hypothetical protein
MNIIIFVFVILCLLNKSASKSLHINNSLKHNGKHKPQSHELLLANEFQTISPHNIKFNNEKNDDSIYELTFEPKVINNDDEVIVRFKSSSPTSKDWIGAYSPANVDIKLTVPVKLGYCDEDDNYLTNGNGQLVFNMTNLRADVGFFYFSNGTYYPILQKKSLESLTFENINQPLRPRVVPTGDYDVFNLLWSSATSETPVLKWGTTKGVYTNTINAVTTEITQKSMCGAPAISVGWREQGLIHTAPFNGMKELQNKKVYYIFGDVNTNDFSKEFTLNVPPLAGNQPESRPTTVILYDDMGRGSNDDTFTWNEYGRPAINTSQSVAHLVNNGEIDAIYHGGDISYATGYAAVWDFYLDMMSPVTAGVPYLTTVGNHESDWLNSASLYSNTDSGGECGVMTTTHIPMPSPATLNEPWWSYEVGLIHFIGMSTEHNYTIGSKQYLWLEHDLINIDRVKTPWVIFGGHRAMYLNSNYGGTETSDQTVMALMIENLEPLLFKYRVNIGFYGHNHAVQRHASVLNSVVIQHAEEKYNNEFKPVYWHNDPQATVHFVVGTGGADFTKNSLNPPPDWNELTFYRWGYAKVTAFNSTNLYWEWIDSSNDDVIDRVMMVQDIDFEKSWDPQPWVEIVE